MNSVVTISKDATPTRVTALSPSEWLQSWGGVHTLAAFFSEPIDTGYKHQREYL
jgi:hypothetical protein